MRDLSYLEGTDAMTTEEEARGVHGTHYAHSAGQPDIILHGTASLAMAASRIVGAEAGGDPTRLKRFGGRCAAMVLMPSTISYNTHSYGDGFSHYQLQTESGYAAISNGFANIE